LKHRHDQPRLVQNRKAAGRSPRLHKRAAALLLATALASPAMIATLTSPALAQTPGGPGGSPGGINGGNGGPVGNLVGAPGGSGGDGIFDPFGSGDGGGSGGGGSGRLRRSQWRSSRPSLRDIPGRPRHAMGAGHDINLRMSAAISAGERSAGIGAMNRPSGPIR